MGRSERKGKKKLKRLKLNLELPLDSSDKPVRVVEEVFEKDGELQGEIVSVDVGDGEGETRAYRTAAPIRKLFARGAISKSDYEAGDRFEKAYRFANLAPRFVGIDFTRPIVDTSSSDRSFIAAVFTDRAKECFDALNHVGLIGASLLVHVVGNELSFSDWVTKYARPNNWGRSMDQTSAMWVLRATLSSLSAFYRDLDRENGGWLRTRKD